MSVTKLVDPPTSDTVIGDNLEADTTDTTGRTLTGNLQTGYEAKIAAIDTTEAGYTVALYDADGNEVANNETLASGYTFGGTNAGAGTYYLVFTLEGDNLWTDGTSDPKEYTFTVTE